MKMVWFFIGIYLQSVFYVLCFSTNICFCFCLFFAYFTWYLFILCIFYMIPFYLVSWIDHCYSFKIMSGEVYYGRENGAWIKDNAVLHSCNGVQIFSFFSYQWKKRSDFKRDSFKFFSATFFFAAILCGFYFPFLLRVLHSGNKYSGCRS